MAFAVAAIRLDEFSTDWAISFGNSLDVFRRTNSKTIYSNMPLNLLVESDGKTITAIGHEADGTYAYLRDKNAHGKYYYFTNIFVMLRENYGKLCNEESQVTLQDEMGKSLPALTVFSLVIKYLIDDLKTEIKHNPKDRSFDLERDLFLVITVPALLKEIREINLITKSAVAAGMDANMFSVVTDVDAVSIFYNNSASDVNRYSECTRGLKYLIVRAGVTIDIVKHEAVQKDELKEVSTVASCKGGITLVDEAIDRFLVETYGKDVFEKFKAENAVEHLELKKGIQAKKIHFCPRDMSTVNLRIPPSLTHLYEKCTGKGTIDLTTKSRDVIATRDKLRLSPNIFMSFFEKATNQVVSCIKTELDNENMDIVLFGQFADLPVLQETVESMFPHIRVISELDVLNGAVMIGKRRIPARIIKRAPTHMMVAAIDFGTTYSGWASSFHSDFTSDPIKASSTLWNSGSSLTDKTPTCVLIRPDGHTLEAFGYDAENRYIELIDSGEHAKYYYFRRFKMLLNIKLGEKISRDIQLEDEIGRSLPAIDVFAASIRYLKDDVLKAVDKRLKGQIHVHDIYWVLTVPAIWTDGAKQFMRESAIKAGIESGRLTIALEPEAASIYCRHLPLEATVNYTGVSVSSFKAGARYMILDAGGGTIDITVHEVNEDDGVKEVHAACGGCWGGTMVDKEFEKVLHALVGEDIFQRFKIENLEDYFVLWREFEIKKRAASPSNKSPVKLRFPRSLIDLFRSKTTLDLANVISKSKYGKDLQLASDKMKFSADLFKSFFTNSMDNTVNYVKNTLVDIQVTAILMVGGYSESPMLQQAIRSAFANIEMVIPLEASLSIVKGALIFGHSPRFITTRVLKYTYGIGVAAAFVKGKHPESKLILTDTGDRCDNIFSKHVEKNQSVTVGEPQVYKSYIPIYKQQKQMNIPLYASNILNPEYTDQDCDFLGKMSADLGNEGDLDRKVLVALTFSDTEIVVKAKEEISGKETNASIDFLG